MKMLFGHVSFFGYVTWFVAPDTKMENKKIIGKMQREYEENQQEKIRPGEILSWRKNQG